MHHDPVASQPEGAAAPVLVDVARDRGVHEEPNVWMIHDPA
jgi:hypothetical protein